MPLVGDMVCTTLTLGCVGPLGLLPDGNHGQGRVYDGELRPEAAGRLQGVLHARSGETYRARGIAISSSQVRRPCRPGTGRALARRERDPGAAFERIPRRRRRAVDEIDWENVIEEIESVGRAERGKWVANCAQAIEHLLAIEHWKAATAGDLRHWETEIRAFRIGMAAAIDENPGLQGEYAEMLALAWRHGRARAVERLAGYADDEEGTGSPRPHLRIADAQLPDECPYLTEHVAAYDPKRDKQPQPDVWPPGVEVVFNTALRTDMRSCGDRSAAAAGRGERCRQLR